MKIVGVTRLDSVKQAILLFANCKLSIKPDHRLLGISNDLMEAIYSSADVLKRSTSIHWNKKRQSGFKSMKKKIQGATNEIRNVARIGHYTIIKEMNEVCNWLTSSLGLKG
ncbi:hypothetical protein J1N35_041437 [Gossypium stocksii]|uniref:Uncharacterized protein n=1 Tax=Gossypium stocksii TaxID=47602 RepID=A0A9D3UFH7_9ROSI|nr:hypothetical protein J1N35_041437 [Gossypium stocksii]